MELRLIDNISSFMLDALTFSIEKSHDVRIAVAFASLKGFGMIEQPIHTILESGASTEFLVGMDLKATDPKALWRMYELSRAVSNFSLYCFTDLEGSKIYHPKLYLMNSGAEYTAIIGSSNLTMGGLKRNIEVNVTVTTCQDDEFMSDAYEVYRQLKFLEARKEPDEELLSMYEELCRREKRERRTELQEVLSKFSMKAESLHSPKATKKDLIGWLELVYDSLPDGEFTNKDIYAFESEFQKHYPDNRNIRDKIRQQLQYLRDMGLLEDLGRSRWKKV